MEQICTNLKPDWDGTPVSNLGEAIALASTPTALVLFAATILAVRFRHQWGALITVVLWSLYVSFLTMFDTSGLLAAARAEGCLGSPTLFIAAVAAICVGMIIYTAPSEKRET